MRGYLRAHTFTVAILLRSDSEAGVLYRRLDDY
jgi:hypothetical protein